MLIKTCRLQIAEQDHECDQKIDKTHNQLQPDQLIYFVQTTMGNLFCKTNDNGSHVHNQLVAGDFQTNFHQEEGRTGQELLYG